jgi:signal transduction histidine kinase
VAKDRKIPLASRLLPRFFAPTKLPSGDRPLFNYQRIWRNAILGMAVVTILPLVVLTLFNMYQYEKTMQAEMAFPVTRLVSDTRSAMSSFLQERTSALDFILHDNSFEEVSDQRRLGELFANMNDSFGGFVDLGVIDESGIQLAYVGPYDLRGRDYSGQNWFGQVQDRGVFVSEVFKGYRHIPHFVIAASQSKEGGGFYVIRATFDAEQMTRRIRSLDTRPGTDVFLINSEGILQTDSAHFGGTLDRYALDVPPTTRSVKFREVTAPDGSRLVMGWTSIPGTPFVLVAMSHARDLLSGWWKLRGSLAYFLILSAVIILVVVIAVVTYLVERVYEADLRRTITLRNMEHTNKMASIGRLAAGVAHEINNPLAIIAEKAGLMRDLIATQGAQVSTGKLSDLADSVLRSVERCSNITHRLLGFAKHVEVDFKPLDTREVVREVLELLGKEAEYRNIKVTLEADDDLPTIRSDRGQLQQVLLNIINNAFAAVDDGGAIDLSIEAYRKNRIAITVTDNGTGISQSDLKRIFEPFFTTKKEKGTGLGLSITYGLVQKLGGEIRVKSEEGVGTTFTVLLPLEPPENQPTREGEDT